MEVPPGRYVDGHWVLGGIERGTDKICLVPVQRNSATLISIVQQYVRRGTTDLWGAYSSLGQCGYVHGTVNHSQNFVDPVTKVHTNSIEGMWTHAKKLKNHSTSEDLFGSYLIEYMWRRRINHVHITVIYPV